MAETDLEGKKLAAYRGAWRRMLELTLALHRAGVPLLAGTDYTEGRGLHREIALYVGAGIPALEALRIGTWNGARSLRATAEAGSEDRIDRGAAVMALSVLRFGFEAAGPNPHERWVAAGSEGQGLARTEFQNRS